MIITGTVKIKGALDLAAIGIQIAQNESRSIPNSDFWKTDVQRALKGGFITATKESGDIEEDEEIDNLPVKCLNSYHRPLNILKRQDQIPSGSEFTLTRAEFGMPEIQAALARGMISVVDAMDNEYEQTEIEETTINVSKIIEKHEQDLKSEERDAQYDSHAKRPTLDLDTNEELVTPSVVIHQSPPSKTEEVQRKKTIIWNPTGATEGNSMKKAVVTSSTKSTETTQDHETTTVVAKGVIDTENPAPVNSNEHDVNKQAFVVEPSNKEIEFVDQKIERERKNSHPILKNEPDVINDDVSLIDPDEERRKQHPILKDTEEEDDIFV